MDTNRRQFLGAVGMSAGAVGTFGTCGFLPTAAPAGVFPSAPQGTHELPDLPYAYDALQPHVDAETMRLHHQRHHGGAECVDNCQMSCCPNGADNRYQDPILHSNRCPKEYGNRQQQQCA